MKYLILFTTLIFAAELEVDGDLKVTGTVDASGNPITNVGAALSMTDAINGNVLQSALRDDGVYEYKIFYVAFPAYSDWFVNTSYQYITKYQLIDFTESGDGWDNKLNDLTNDGWGVSNVIFKDTANIFASGGAGVADIYIFMLKRKVSDD